jgi:hypothetical protein
MDVLGMKKAYFDNNIACGIALPDRLPPKEKKAPPRALFLSKTENSGLMP